jgi:putative ABC transport system ATP-binding protein
VNQKRADKADGDARAGIAFALDRVGHSRGGVAVLSDLTLAIRRCKMTAVIGPSGSGKTSLLRLLNRLEDPVSGSIALFDRDLRAYPVRELRRRVAFVFQSPVMFEGSIADNLLAASRLRKANDTPKTSELDLLLESVDIDPSIKERDARGLSGGEKQRVALARALASRPEVLLLDEPTAALDVESAEHLMTMLARLRTTQRLTMVMVTHRLGEALAVGDDLVLLEGGSIVEAGSVDEMRHAPRAARTRQFMQSAHEASP